jgi:hypothetical protein
MKDWKRHKKICKLLNVGHGDMQVRTPMHTIRSIHMKELFERQESCLDEEDKRFFKLFEESTFEGSRAAAGKMTEIVKRQHKVNHMFLLFHSFYILARSKSEMLSWPNSPLRVLLQFVDPNVMSGDEDATLQEDHTRETPLHRLADLTDPSDYLTHKNQLILAKQLIEHGANVNALSIPQGRTPLHNACYAAVVTNLDFVELLLEEGADPNVQDYIGLTPLMLTATCAPGAAKFLLKWPTTDANITERSGVSFLTLVRMDVKDFSYQIAFPFNPEQVQHKFLLQQWIEIEEMLAERGAHATRIE